MINRLRADIIGRLANQPTEFQAGRLGAFLEDLNKLIAESMRGLSESVLDEARALAASETAFNAELFGKVTNIEGSYDIPTDSALIASVLDSSMTVDTKAVVSPRQALRNFSDKKALEITRVITDGAALGKTNTDIANDVSGLMRTRHQREIATVVKTITNHTANVARVEVLKSNQDLVDGYRWISTLDSSTTLVCAGRDQKTWQTGAGPVPPAHYNCRSTIIPAVKQEFQKPIKSDGERPALGADGVEDINNRTSYGTWLKRQPSEFQDEALGPERAQLFRSGKVKMDEFTDPTGRVLTLRELESKSAVTQII